MKTFPEALRRGVSGAIGVGEAQDLSGADTLLIEQLIY